MNQEIVGRLSPNVPGVADEDIRPTQFVVRSASTKCALQFVRNLTGRFANHVVDATANKFDTEWEAELKAKEFGLTHRDFYVEALP